MPVVETVRCNKGMSEQELQGRLNQGWILIGRQAVSTGVASPNNPGGIVDVDIWMMQEPMMPQRLILEALVQYGQHNEGAHDTLDDLTRALFDVGIDRLTEEVMKRTEGV